MLLESGSIECAPAGLSEAESCFYYHIAHFYCRASKRTESHQMAAAASA